MNTWQSLVLVIQDHTKMQHLLGIRGKFEHVEGYRTIDLGEVVEGGLENIIMQIKSVCIVKVGGGGSRRHSGGRRAGRGGRGGCINT